MKRNICFLFTFIFLCCSVVFAEGEKNAEYGVIAVAFKNIAKAYISVVDIAKLKKDNIRVLRALDEAAFRKNYGKILKGIKELPPGYRAKYGLTVDMNRDEAARIINSWNKKRLYAMIDDVPAEFVEKYFKEYMQKHKQRSGAKDLLLNVKDFWERIVSNPQRYERQGVKKSN